MNHNANHVNVKGILIAQLANAGLGSPIFQCVQQGPSHAPLFHATVLLGEYIIGEGQGKTKKEAERVASAQALEVDLDSLITEDSQKSQNTAPNTANTASQENQISEVATTDSTADGEEMWPIYSEVLAKSIDIAFELAHEKDGPTEVRETAARFYRDLLSSLGHQPTRLAETTEATDC